MQNQKISVNIELDNLKKDREKLEGIIAMDRFLLEKTLRQALVNLKVKRPDLFTFTRAEQIALILKALLK